MLHIFRGDDNDDDEDEDDDQRVTRKKVTNSHKRERDSTK